MNLFIHGLDGNIQLGNSYFDDKHSTVKADFVLANPPFNDGSKAEAGWGADRIADNDPRLVLDGERMLLSARNANTMWMMHFLSHLKEGGTAGFVMAGGELSSSESARFSARQALVKKDYVDCVVQLSGQLFANTPIPCSLWLLSKNRRGDQNSRKRMGEILFIDGRRLGKLIPGSRKQKQLTPGEIDEIARVYRLFCHEAPPAAVPGFCRVVTRDEVQEHGCTLTPGRYVGAQESDDEDEAFEEKFPRLLKTLEDQFSQSAALERLIKAELNKVRYES